MTWTAKDTINSSRLDELLISLMGFIVTCGLFIISLTNRLLIYPVVLGFGLSLTLLLKYTHETSCLHGRITENIRVSNICSKEKNQRKDPVKK